jgi:DNA-directed RNA polymerase specialized sigma24 family protein
MELLSRTEGDEWTAVDVLYGPLRRFAAVVAPPDLEPDDMLQEALVSVLRSHRLSDLDHPGAYLRKAVLNVAVSHNRRMGRRRRALSRYASDRTDRIWPEYPSDLSDLAALPPRERGALYLHEVEGYRYSEIGEMLGCSEAAAKKAGARGRRRFEQLAAVEVTE